MSDYDYDGWAPCAHSEEEIETATQFIKDQTPDFTGNINPKFKEIHGGLLEDMLWQLSDLTGRGDIEVDFDQWCGVYVTGAIVIKDVGPKHFKTRVQSDTLLLGVAESLRWWDEKYKELHADLGPAPEGQDN